MGQPLGSSREADSQVAGDFPESSSVAIKAGTPSEWSPSPNEILRISRAVFATSAPRRLSLGWVLFDRLFRARSARIVRIEERQGQLSPVIRLHHQYQAGDRRVQALARNWSKKKLRALVRPFRSLLAAAQAQSPANRLRVRMLSTSANPARLIPYR